MTLQVQVGDVITNGSTVVLIAWTNRKYTPGARDGLGTDSDVPSARATPVDAICLVPPVGDGQFMGTAMEPRFLRYLGWIHPTEEEINAAITANDDYAARDGHTFEVTVDGYRHLTHPWWEDFRQAETQPKENS